MASIINASTSGAGGVITTADASGVLNLQSGGTTIAAVSSTGVAVTGTLSATTITVPSGTTLTSPALAGTPTGVGILTSGTAVASTSGTSIDFTSIPSWVKRITVMFNGVSTNGSSPVIIQLGTSSGLETSSYLGTAQNLDATAISGSNNFTNGFRTMGVMGATIVFQGISTVTLLGSNIWCFSSLAGRSEYNGQLSGSGAKTLSGTLDRIRITTVNGTDTFDAGSINIMYE